MSICSIGIWKPKGQFCHLKFVLRYHFRKFSHRGAQSNVEVTNEKSIGARNDTQKSLPVIFVKRELKCIDLDAKAPLYNVEKFKAFIKEQSLDSKTPNCSLDSNVIETKLEAISEGDTKKLLKPKLIHRINLHDLEWREQILDTRNLLAYYAKLSKIRLTGLVVTTAVAGYVMAPAYFNFTSFAAVTVGTGLMSGAANTINQFLEVPFDSQMSRTKNRVLVKGYLSELHAVAFATASGILGLSMLYTGCNPLTAGLGALNLVLYTCFYTPMKRYSILNTWIGSVVGAIPPLMGWAACAADLDTGAWLMAGLLFAWQFPHFNALSWNLRPDYSRAGYRMMSVINPKLCRKTAFRYSVCILALSSIAPLLDVTTWMFAIDSLPLNTFFVYRAWKFRQNGDSSSARKLFLFSLIHLPALMLLILISKKHYSKSKCDGNLRQKISSNISHLLNIP